MLNPCLPVSRLVEALPLWPESRKVYIPERELFHPSKCQFLSGGQLFERMLL